MIKWAGKKRNFIIKGSFPISLFVSLQHSGSALHAGEWEERERDMEETKHFDHKHRLSLRKEPDGLHCTAYLFNWNDGRTLYICSEGCSYALHQSCAMLSASQELQGLFHHHTHLPYIDSYVTISINPMCDTCREEYCDFTNYEDHFPL